ncbi:MAG TPA: DUF1573 domain-containing protein [Cyclobacteriaceae bacterium]|nr:DUF1573 domain-containing protein [Cyclobacteriaceae bacterium]
MKAKLILLIVVTALATSCRDKEAEKKIAALEARLSELEGKKNSPALSQTPQPTQPEVKPEGPLPVFQFETTDHDFGTIKEGEKVTYTYKFKNTGDAPLIVQEAKGSCGCTASDWSKMPIPPGGEGFVKAEFDSNGKPNVQNKTVTVTANTWPKQTVLKFKAMVMPKADSGPVK